MNGTTESPGMFSPEGMQNLYDLILEKLVEILPPVLIALIVLLIASRIVGAAMRRLQDHLIKVATTKRRDNVPGESEKRIKTLFAIFNKAAFITLWCIGALVVLQIVGVQIGPIIAAAGVLGLAISFGAQSLVKDVIAGVFVLFENQIRVGDIAIINGQGGLVEEINLRTVILRDVQGVVHVFPNGRIDKLSNMTKDWSAFVIDMGVAYKEDVDKVMEVMKQVAAELGEDEAFKDKIINEIEVFGLDSFGDSAIVIKARIKTKPIEQWVVGREYRRRLKKAFDRQGIEIPFPHRTLYFGEASPAFEVLMRQGKESTAEITNQEK